MCEPPSYMCVCVYIYIYVYIIYIIYIYIYHIYQHCSNFISSRSSGRCRCVTADPEATDCSRHAGTGGGDAAGVSRWYVDEHGLRVAIGHYVTRLLRAKRMEYVAGQVVHLARLAVGRTSAGDVRLPELRRRDRARVSRRSCTATLSQRNASVIQAVR